MKIFHKFHFFNIFCGYFRIVLQIVHTSPQILTLSAKNRKILPNFHRNQAEKAVFFIRRMKFHFSFSKI